MPVYMHAIFCQHHSHRLQLWWLIQCHTLTAVNIGSSSIGTKQVTRSSISTLTVKHRTRLISRNLYDGCATDMCTTNNDFKATLHPSVDTTACVTCTVEFISTCL